MAKLPLEGIRILDMTVVWAGPYGTMFLADMEAEVIRVETLRVSAGRTRGLARPLKAAEARMAPGRSQYPGRNPGKRPWNRNATFNTHARNKHSMTANLNTPEGRDIFRRLVEISDGFVENNAPGTMARLGLSYDVLSQWNPRLIMISSAGFGQTGPWSGYRGYGMQFEAAYGHGTLSAYPDMGPLGIPVNVSADAATGVGIALALTMALHQRHRTGQGLYIDLSQGENFLIQMGEYFLDYSMNRREAQPLGNRHPTAVQGCYRCMGDDQWIAITIETDQQWQALCQVMERTELAQDERFADALSRYRHHDEIDEIIGAWTQDNDNIWLFHHLQKVGVPAGPLIHEAEAYHCPQLWERRFFVPITQEDTGPYLYPGAPFKMSKMPFVVRKPPVRLGEDNEYVYKELLGLSHEDYAGLEASGHIGMDFISEVP